MATYIEKEKKLEIVDSVDVLVIGAGPAGFGAALAAARAGANTMIIEQFNCIGGMATSGMMSHFAGAQDCPMFLETIHAMRENSTGCFNEKQEPGMQFIYHEALKDVMLEKLIDAGVKVKLYTFACEVIMEKNTITGVICESKTGRNAVMSKVVIDCSGDGDIAAKAGAAFQLGREGDQVCQPVTLMFRIGGVDYSRAIFPGSFEALRNVPKGEIQSLGKANLPFPAGHVLLYRTFIPEEVCVNMTNVINIDGTKAEDLTRAEIACRKQIKAIIDFLREYAPGYEKCYLLATAQTVGVRETRHFKGVYTITGEDIWEGKVFDDWIATRNFFNFDIHNTEGSGLDKDGAQRHFKATGLYTIPYRACVPEKIDGLLLAGRNISGTHKAHSNFRVMSICMNIGHGVGTAAALAAKYNILPRNVNVNEVQAILKADGMKENNA